jgi:hypothetical protein
MNPRQRVFATFDHEETDLIPIYTPSFERTAAAYHNFQQWRESQSNFYPKSPSIDLSIPEWQEAKFWDADLWPASPFPSPLKSNVIPPPAEYPTARIKITGTIKLPKLIPTTGEIYFWYHDGYFKTKEILQTYWEKYGRPTSWLDDGINYTRTIWSQFSSSLENDFVPFLSLPFTLHEALFEGMTPGRLRYYMNKDPAFIHTVANEYATANIDFIKRIAEAGVEIVFFFDDLGQRNRPLISLRYFREFILPEYQRIYQTCRKHGLICVHHCCGKMDDFIPDMIQAGLQALQSLEPAAGMDFLSLKERYGDKITLLGGIDSTIILNFGSFDAIKDHIKSVCEIGRNRGGYFVGPSHNLLNTPWENILAVRDAIQRFR